MLYTRKLNSMLNSFFLFLVLLIGFNLCAQSIEIEGYAPSYVGDKIDLLAIDDYLSQKKTVIYSSRVGEDSLFKFKVDNIPTQRLLIRSNNNTGFLYVQPNGQYQIYFPEKDKYDPYRKTGNNVEVTFFGLDSTDINYKILGFQRWVDNFIGNNYHLKSVDPIQFVNHLDTFKINVEKAYKSDTSNFFKNYIRYTIAGIDNIATATQRSRYEKYDFYLKGNTVHYKNDVFMGYFTDFYDNLLPQLVTEVNNEVYKGIIKASPTVIMNALGKEYTLKNVRYRELVMIMSLADVYYSDDYPQTNIITVLDSISEHALFEENKLIAKNVTARLTELVAGGKAPNFVLLEDGKSSITLLGLKGKHVYLHFVDPDNTDGMKEITLLKDLHAKYGEYVQFITIYKDQKYKDEKAVNELEELPWSVYKIGSSNSIWKNYQVASYPHYVLLDPTGYVVASPALKPTPNGQYETIDKTFFYIRKAWLDANSER